jgi:hypothetical protein
MMYPLVRKLAGDGIPVAVKCRVLKLARQPYCRWLNCPVTARQLNEAYLADALFDSHRDDPEYGYRLLADEARDTGHTACDRRMWRICSGNGWWSGFGKRRRGKAGRPGPPAHEDEVRPDFTAPAPNRLLLTDISEHPTSEGSCTCALPRTSSPGGSSATRSATG